MQSIWSNNKLSSSDSVNIASSSASVTSIHSKKLANQFSALDLVVSTWLAQLLQSVSNQTVGINTTTSETSTPLAIRLYIPFSVAFTDILIVTDSDYSKNFYCLP